MDVLMVGVEAAHPRSCLHSHLPLAPASGKIILLAGGKAAGEMMKIACQYYLEQVDKERIIGIAVHHHETDEPLFHMQQISAGHPVPDDNSQRGALRVLELAAGAGADDMVVVLISGGASALWSAPIEGVSLFDKQDITRALLRSGADIVDINCVRKHLSRIKGGALAKTVAPARLVTLAISDVVGDDPSSIASGPTSPDQTTLADARKILGNHHIKVPTSISEALDDPRHETLKQSDEVFDNACVEIIAKGAMSLKAAEQQLVESGIAVINLGDRIVGEARDIAVEHARLALEAQKKMSTDQPVALLSGGELTVTIKGAGKGGPNQEYALALCGALRGSSGISAIAADTDGCDGGRGLASDPAGALVFPSTWERALARKLNPATFLANNDSGRFFEILEDLVKTGPTHTNVNDFRFILINKN
ncbi:MAG: glycerate kinase [bacterium]|nr:glycerate kinase [bacterium]